MWRALQKGLSARTVWREKITASSYISWTQSYFDAVRGKCENVRDNGTEEEGITHDAYMKVAQVSNVDYVYHDVVAIDEAQDMSPCQADLFWGPSRRTA